MSFEAFGKSSGPVGPPNAQPTFGRFPHQPSSPLSTPQFPGSSARPQSPSPRTFGAYKRAQSSLPFDNIHLTTGPPRPSVAPISAAPLQWGDRQSSIAGDVGGGAIQQRSPPSDPRDIGTSISSRVYRFQGLERTRSPPVQYTEDFLNPDNDGKEGAAPLRWGDRQSSLAGDVGGPIQKRSPASGPRDLGTSIPSKAYRFQDLEGTQSSPVKYNEDFLHLDEGGEEGASLSSLKSRSGTGIIGMPKFQYNQRSSPSADGMNGGAYAKRLVSHSVSKRSRSPPAAAGGQISLTNTFSSEDDTERELQAKAKRLARFKTELDEAGPIDSVQYGSNAAKKKISLVKTDQPVVAKKKFSGDYPSRSMEDVSQEFDNEDLQSNSVIVGLCPDMCPESERAERERKGDLDRYERLDGDRNQTSKVLAVKKYNRTAEREAELIRPMPILQKTMDYLLGLLDQPYDDRFLGLYNFLWDRMRAIRMDLRMQHIFNHEAITMLEQMIRLHIVAMHELCEFSKGEGFSEGFDAHLNIEQMNKTSVELFQLYDDHRKRGILIPTEKEFRGYYALLKLDKHPGYKVEPAELSLDLAKMTAEIRQTHEVLFARDVARSCRTGNFIAFFRHARQGSYLQACLMHAHFSKLRTQALASLHSGLLYNQGLPVSQAANWLGMEGEDIESLLEYHGFSIKEFEEPYMVKEGPFLNVDKDYPTRCSTLVHGKKSTAILEDILSSHQKISSLSESKREIRFDENKKTKQTAVKRKQTETAIVSKKVMDIEAASAPAESMRVQPAPETSRSMQVEPLFETPKIGQPSMENYHRASVSSPRSNISTPNAFASFQSHSMQEQRSPVTPRDSSLIVDDGQLNHKSSPVDNFSVPQSVPDAQPPYFGGARETSYDGLIRSPPGSSPRIIASSELKATQTHISSANDKKWMPTASEVDSGVPSSLQDDAIVEVASKEFTDEQHEVKNDDDSRYYDKEVAEAKLKLFIRLWKRSSVRKRESREQNRLAANAALSSLSLGPPIRHIKDKPMLYRKLNIDQTVAERQEKLQQSWARWNISELVAGKLSEKNSSLSCICWKVVSFSWLRHNNIEARNPVTHLSVDQWLRYKLIPAQEDETVNDLVMSAPGLSIWSKWVPGHSDAITCCLSVIKEVESGNFEKKLDGVNAILFPLSETLAWELQRVELHNFVMSLPAGSRLPLLILSGSSGNNIGEFPHSIVDKLGLNYIDKSRIGSFMVICLNETEVMDQFYGYFSDQKLKEGLLWLASESHPQPVLYNVNMRELVCSHLNIFSDALDISDSRDPNQCISTFNQALNQSVNDVLASANMNPTGWPCPEVFLLDDSTAEFRAVRLFLPSLGWSSSEEVEPLTSALRSCKLPSFSDDMSWLNRGCTSVQDFESQRQLLQESLIRYLTQSGNVMNWMMAEKEADVMLKKCTRLELHDTEYKLIPNWLLIFQRVFNWRLNQLASITCKAYILEQLRATSRSSFCEKSDCEVSAPLFISHPSLDEMVEVSCSPLVSKRVKSSPKCLQDMSVIASVRSASGVVMFNLFEEEQNQCSPIEVQPVNDSDIYMGESDSQVVPKAEKEPDSLSKLLEQCNALQDEIEKKLSIYF